jgi:colicin import membrane protein
MDQFSRFLFISVILHSSLGLVWMIQTFLMPKAEVTYQKAIRIDMIGLPDKITPVEPEPAPANQPEAKVQTDVEKKKDTFTEAKQDKVKGKSSSPKQSNDPGTSLKKKVEAKSNLGVSKLSQLSALEKLEQSVAAEESKNRMLKQMLFKGNAIVEGSSLTGINKIEAEDYVGSVESHVRAFWKLPQWLANSKKRAKALVRWDSRGIPVLIQVIESSGSDEFDQIVMETLQKAAPFPEPPEKFAVLMRRQGVVFGFPE